MTSKDLNNISLATLTNERHGCKHIVSVQQTNKLIPRSTTAYGIHDVAYALSFQRIYQYLISRFHINNKQYWLVRGITYYSNAASCRPGFTPVVSIKKKRRRRRSSYRYRITIRSILFHCVQEGIGKYDMASDGDFYCFRWIYKVLK